MAKSVTREKGEQGVPVHLRVMCSINTHDVGSNLLIDASLPRGLNDEYEVLLAEKGMVITNLLVVQETVDVAKLC